ncbi:hypothetical protein V8J88_15475 [Massilia sp. W12]|uniref:hypothetical protein n=1 Tax=Massilia sp. W12 TaxID=3126507 RepID=UPI0030CC8BF8
MTTEIARQLIYAFSQGGRGGNPSFLIVSSGAPPDWAALAPAAQQLARTLACEVSHLHLGQQGTQLRFYVAAGELAFCGHGALAAAAWGLAHGQLQPGMQLHYAHGSVQIQQDADGAPALLEQAGALHELPLCAALSAQAGAMLGWPALPEASRLWLGGRQRAKALILLPAPADLRALVLQPALRDQFCLEHGVSGIYPMCFPAPGQVLARHFPLHAHELEDMATGNIAASVAALCGAPQVRISQGGPDCDQACLRVQTGADGGWLVGGACRFA